MMMCTQENSKTMQPMPMLAQVKVGEKEFVLAKDLKAASNPFMVFESTMETFAIPMFFETEEEGLVHLFQTACNGIETTDGKRFVRHLLTEEDLYEMDKESRKERNFGEIEANLQDLLTNLDIAENEDAFDYSDAMTVILNDPDFQIRAEHLMHNVDHSSVNEFIQDGIANLLDDFCQVLFMKAIAESLESLHTLPGYHYFMSWCDHHQKAVPFEGFLTLDELAERTPAFVKTMIASALWQEYQAIPMDENGLSEVDWVIPYGIMHKADGTWETYKGTERNAAKTFPKGTAKETVVEWFQDEFDVTEEKAEQLVAEEETVYQIRVSFTRLKGAETTKADIKEYETTIVHKGEPRKGVSFSDYEELIWKAIECEGYENQPVWVSVIIERNGEFWKHDEGDLHTHIVRTDEPSAFFLWGEEPANVFAIDRKQSTFSIEA